MADISFADGARLAGVLAISAFLWNLHRDIANLHERMARLEGLFASLDATPKRYEPIAASRAIPIARQSISIVC